MYVEQMMTRTVISVTPDAKLNHMMQLMRDRHVRHLPVVDAQDRLVGLVSERDLQRASPSPITTFSTGEVNYLLKKVTAEKIMHREVVTCTPDTIVEKAACMMRDRSIGCLPVVEKERLVGILTGVDLIDFFLDVSGCRVEGTARVTVSLPDERGQLSNLLSRIEQLGGHVISVLAPVQPDKKGLRIAIIRYRAEEPASVDRQLAEAGYEIFSENIPGS